MDLNVSERRLSPKNDFTENSGGRSSKDKKTGDKYLVETFALTGNLNLLGYDSINCSDRSEN